MKSRLETAKLDGMTDAMTLSMKGLPYAPINPTWVLESRAFHSDDARLVRAATNMLLHAWRGEPAGSVPADMQRLGGLCGLSHELVTEHWGELTEGWTLRGERLFHNGMSGLCERLHAKFPDVLESLADQAAAVVQAPEEFELVPPTVESRTRGRRLLPKDFQLTDRRRLWLKGHGVEVTEDQDFVFEKFVSHYRRLNEKMNDWDAAFENFALKEDKRRLPSQQRAVVVPLTGPGGFAAGSRAGRYGGAGRGQQAVDHNLQMAERVGRGGDHG